MLKKKVMKSGKCKVTFSIPADQLPVGVEVKSIAVVADFNEWSMVANPMKQTKSGGYQMAVELEANESFEYRYLINDLIWFNDWQADGYIANRLGNADNCIVATREPDDLRKVEGIGPKIAGLLNADGIATFAELANAPVDQLKGILTAAGSRYQMHDPSSWPQQAGLAAEGAWKKLEKLQDKLSGGKKKKPAKKKK